MSKITKEELLAFLKGRLTKAEREKEAFLVKAQEDLSGALEWSMEAFRAAATIQLATEMVQALEDPEAGNTAQHTLEYAARNAMRCMENPRRSTCPVSNLIHQEQGRFYAEIARTDWRNR